jgi:hypothetical protein
MDPNHNEERHSFVDELMEGLTRVIGRLPVFAIVAVVGALFPLVDLLLLAKSDWSLYFGVAGVAFVAIINVVSERWSAKLLSEAIAFQYRLINREGLSRPKMKEVAISLTFLSHLKRRNAGAKIALAFAASISAISQLRYPDASLLSIAIACTFVLALILVKEALVEFRIRKGYFGTTRSEVKDLIAFMVANAKDIDFHDDSGALRKALIPYCDEQPNGEAPFIPGGVQS